jgi:hypothetical protein
LCPKLDSFCFSHLATMQNSAILPYSKITKLILLLSQQYCFSAFLLYHYKSTSPQSRTYLCWRCGGIRGVIKSAAFRGYTMAEEFVRPEDNAVEPNSNQSSRDREQIKHLLIGSPKIVRKTIHTLHGLGYAEVREWSKPLSAGELGHTGEVVSILVRHILSK